MPVDYSDNLEGLALEVRQAKSTPKRSFKIVDSLEDVILRIYPDSMGLYQIPKITNKRDRQFLSEVIDFLVDHGAEEIYIFGSVLSREGYNDIDLGVVVEGVEEGTELTRALRKSPNYAIEEQSMVPYFMGHVAPERVKVYKAGKRGKPLKSVRPVDLSIVTREWFKKHRYGESIEGL